MTSNSSNSSTTAGLIFHESMLQTDEKLELNKKVPVPDELAQRKARARRTAWIIAAIAIAFFVASLLHGHFVGIPNWVPTR